MSRARSLTDRLLVRAWIEPGHDLPLRVVVRHLRGEEPQEEEQAFTDAGRAAAFVRTWLQGLVRRSETGDVQDGATDGAVRRDGGGA